MEWADLILDLVIASGVGRLLWQTWPQKPTPVRPEITDAARAMVRAQLTEALNKPGRERLRAAHERAQARRAARQGS